MRYLEERVWTVVPTEIVKVKRSCSKCGQESLFINSEKFRVNANKNKVDIWLIYQCEKCKTTWNMTIYERIRPKAIEASLLDAFMNNDLALAKAYGFNKELLARNKLQVDYESLAYEVLGDSSPLPKRVRIVCHQPIDIRVIKIIAKKLEISRSKLKKMCDNMLITDEFDQNISKLKLKDELTIKIKA